MTTTHEDDACLSDLVLDQWLADELDAEGRETAAAHLASCTTCRARIDTIEAETAAFLSQAPTLSDHAGLLAEANEAQRMLQRNRRMMLASSVLAVAAMVSLAVVTQRADEGTRLKGNAHVDFFVKRGEQVTQGVSGEVVHPGELVRFTTSSAQVTHLALINIDGKGATVYYPQQGRTSAVIAAGKQQALDFSVELDDQVGTERVFAVFCPEPFEIADVIAGLNGPQPTPPSNCHLDVITLQKEALP
jgi:hypothetical protein